jgi:hypothetical protein
MNWTRTDMTVAFADYLYENVFLNNPGVFDGVHFDHLVRGISWAIPQRWAAGGIDSIDFDRNGIADDDSVLDYRWKVGTVAFCNRIRELCGDDFILFPNGGVPPTNFDEMNGRFHEGFPGPVGGTAPDWNESMFGPMIGYLVEPPMYSPLPEQMFTLQGLSFYPTNCDPERLSTTESLYDLPCMQPIIDLTLASTLLGDGYSCFSGFARDSQGYVKNYHTTWWLPLYDTLRVNFGEPTTAAYDTLGPTLSQTTWVRQFEGGAVRVTEPGGINTAFAKFEFKPKAVFREPLDGQVWLTGQSRTVRFKGWDPYAPGTLANVKLLLSRNGGASYPDTLGTWGPGDSLATIAVSGATSEACRVRLLARDTEGHVGYKDSGLFAIRSGATAPTVAEAEPTGLVAGETDPLVIAMQTGVSGVSAMRVVRPQTTRSWSVSGVTVNGAPFNGTTWMTADSVVVTPPSPWPQGVRVVLTMAAAADTSIAEPASTIAVAYRVGTPTWNSAAAGNADGDPSDANTLTTGIVAGPLDHINILPPSASIPVDRLRLFIALGRDQYENPVEITPQWSVGGSIGTIDQLGVFRALVPGNGVVIARVGTIAEAATVTVTPDVSVGVEQPPIDPAAADVRELALEPASPNPARGPVSIRYAVPASAAGEVTLSVYDITGRLVELLVCGQTTPGRHELEWSRRDASHARVGPGVYILRLESGATRIHQKLVLID